MSAQKKKAELLTFGYVNRSYDLAIPIALIQLIQLYYDIYYYLSLKGEQLQKFVAAKIGDELYFTSFKIKGIEFEFTARPNGSAAIYGSKGLVIIGIRIKYLPKDIEYFNYYQQIKCEQLNHCKIKALNKINTVNQVTAAPICKLSELTEIDCVDFNCLINIKYIKYKKEAKKEDYVGSINKLHKMSKFKWNINGSMMEKCQKMQLYELLCSDNFDDNNWFLALYPNGWNINNEGETTIFIKPASLSLNRKKINVKSTLFIDGVQYKQNITKFEHNKLRYPGWKIMKFSEFKERESILFEIVIEIINVYDENDKEIDHKE